MQIKVQAKNVQAGDKVLNVGTALTVQSFPASQKVCITAKDEVLSAYFFWYPEDHILTIIRN